MNRRSSSKTPNRKGDYYRKIACNYENEKGDWYGMVWYGMVP